MGTNRHSDFTPVASEASLFGVDEGHQGLSADAETGLVYNRHRYLHVTLGRFTSPDPHPQGRYVDGMNGYEYVGGGPVGAVDPLGLQAAPAPAFHPSASGFSNAATSIGTLGARVPGLPGRVLQGGVTLAHGIETSAIAANTIAYQALNKPITNDEIWDQADKDAAALNGAEWDARKKECDEIHASKQRATQRQPPPGLCPCDLAKWMLNRAEDVLMARGKYLNRGCHKVHNSTAQHRPEYGAAQRAVENAAAKVKRLCGTP
jgi:RHS repeat-associated protein